MLACVDRFFRHHHDRRRETGHPLCICDRAWNRVVDVEHFGDEISCSGLLRSDVLALDRATKLRSQQEVRWWTPDFRSCFLPNSQRQGLAYILLHQATSLLQRTRLHVSVSCQAWHAKNTRHMPLDIIDHNQPIMLIVRSRSLSQLKGYIST